MKNLISFRRLRRLELGGGHPPNRRYCSLRFASRASLSVVKLALIGALSLACSNPVTPAAPAAFDRPEAVAFFCWHLPSATPRPLEACVPGEVEEGEEDFGLPASDEVALHALVTQTGTGEVAAVRLTGTEDDPAGVIDSDVRVPGFTFAAVGEVPSSLAISRTDPKHVFVVSRGSARIHVIDTAAFRKGRGTEVVEYADLLAPSSRPSAAVLSPDGAALIVALPTQGAIARIPVSAEGVLGPADAVELLALETVIPPPVDLTALSEAERPPTYVYTCEVDPAVMTPPVIAPREPASAGPTPEPWSLLLDEETDTLLVADRALPLIHRITLDAATPWADAELAPLSVSVPTRALALTPWVPATASTDAAALTPTERFLYAIDELDRTVLAVDVSDEASARFGAVLPVSVRSPIDRLEAPIDARALAVVTPTYDPAAIAFCTDALQGELAGPTSLHGVFLAVGTLDGSIRFFDVYDLDVPCRGLECAVRGSNPNPDDEIVAIGRHRPRGATVRQDAVRLDPAPTWTTTATTLTLAENGTTTQPGRVPELTAVRCEAPLAPVFGDGARVCAVTDPWAAISQTFTVTWQGVIPFTATSGANLEPGEPGEGDDTRVLLTQTDHCALGVIGSRDVDGPLAGYPGDVVVITTDLPPSILDVDEDDSEGVMRRSDCERLTQRTTSGAFTPVVLPILSASTPDALATYRGRLLVGAPIVPAGGTLAEVEECFPELLQIEIRTRDTFLVRSTRAGFRHPIVRADDGRCVVDPARYDALERGRARCGETFQTEEIAFALGACDPADVDDAASLQLTVGAVPIPLGIDISADGNTNRASVLENLVYNDVDERLYAVDQATRGLLRIRLTSLNVQQAFR